MAKLYASVKYNVRISTIRLQKMYFWELPSTLKLFWKQLFIFWIRGVEELTSENSEERLCTPPPPAHFFHLKLFYCSALKDFHHSTLKGKPKERGREAEKDSREAQTDEGKGLEGKPEGNVWQGQFIMTFFHGQWFKKKPSIVACSAGHRMCWSTFR